MDPLDLDQILRDIGGFSYYQIKRFILVCLIIAFTAFPAFSFIFTTHSVKHRCFVNECDDPMPNFHAEWVRRAIPFKDDGDEPRKCLRYVNPDPTRNCSDTVFNKTETVHCDNFVFENGTRLTLSNDFGIQCEEDLWKLSLVGTINNLGYLLGLPLSGYFSDRFGRLKVLTFSIFISTTIGLAHSFSPNYITFVIAEFLLTFLGAGMYGGAYILGMELLTSEHRVIGSTIMSSAFAVGAVVMGFVAWSTISWRTFLRVLYSPGIIFLAYYWLLDESVRWLMASDKKVRAKNVLKRIARENDYELHNSTIKVLNIVREDNAEIRTDSFVGVFQSPVLFVRLLNCGFVWTCCTFVYYGLSIHSVGISGNMYINYIAVALIEIPAYIASNFSLSRLGRRFSSSVSLLLSGMACIGFVFTPEDDRTLRLILFLLGKFSVTVAFTSIYLHTAEMFPTSFRHSIIALCAGFSRIGSMIAPLVLLLVQVWKSLPTIIFGVVAILSGLSSVGFPETLNTELPDTLEEAERLGKNKNKNISS